MAYFIAYLIVSPNFSRSVLSLHRELAVIELANKLCVVFYASTGGSVVEFSPATREARVRQCSVFHFARFFISCSPVQKKC